VKAGLPEDRLRDALVPARCVEHALVVAAADVDAEGDPGVAADDGVVQLDAFLEHSIRIASALTVTLAKLLVEQRCVLRCVDLDVLASEAP
jgi:hypothetical protein